MLKRMAQRHHIRRREGAESSSRKADTASKKASV
jgi:hypothetical protein